MKGANMNNTTIIILDYFIQSVDAGFTKQEARDRSANMLKNFREETPEEEYTATAGILDRLAAM